MKYLKTFRNKVKNLKLLNASAVVVGSKFLTIDKDGGIVRSDTPDILNEECELAFAMVYVSKAPQPGAMDKTYIMYDGNIYEQEYNCEKFGLSFCSHSDNGGINIFSRHYISSRDFHRLTIGHITNPDKDNALSYVLKMIECNSQMEWDYIQQLIKQGKDIEELRNENISLKALCNTYKDFIDHLVKLIDEKK